MCLTLYSKAKSHFKIFKSIYEKCNNDKMTMYGYKKISEWYQNLGDYDNAIKSAKKMVVIAAISRRKVSLLDDMNGYKGIPPT